MRTGKKTLIQCDFDGTITDRDASFTMLDAFASGDWKQILEEYKSGRISVGDFNTRAFAMVKADRQSLLKTLAGRVTVREGFRAMVDYCQRKNLHLVIVSNGLQFYIEEILSNIGIVDIPIFAAQTEFLSEGLKVQYLGPDGKTISKCFKETHLDSFLQDGYQVIYIGNGPSDMAAAKRSHIVFATGTLLTHCTQANLHCNAFTNFNEIVSTLEAMQGI
ncbi:MAG: HAD-IB family phosphatase [Dehalococcoidia bacterium]|nr:HAD-IB family phosphatase [Dehalococcoidia bacterium]